MDGGRESMDKNRLLESFRNCEKSKNMNKSSKKNIV